MDLVAGRILCKVVVDVIVPLEAMLRGLILDKFVQWKLFIQWKLIDSEISVNLFIEENIDC